MLVMSLALIKLVRVEVVNKSGSNVYVRLDPVDPESQQFYYLTTVPWGDREYPASVFYTFIAEPYYVKVTYLQRENCAPVYGELLPVLDLPRDKRLVINPCVEAQYDDNDDLIQWYEWFGGDGVLKYWRANFRVP